MSAQRDDELAQGEGHDAMMSDVHHHGCIHAHLVDGRAIVVRSGQVFWNEPDGDHFTLETGDSALRVPYDSVVSWELPYNVWLQSGGQ